MRRRSAWIPELDTLRGLAALGVVLGHHPDLPPSWRPIQDGASTLAVFFFFSLSGFLLTHLAVREQDRTGRFSCRAFYLRRIFRIWPLYFLTIILAASVLRMGLGLPQPTDTTALVGALSKHALFMTNWSMALKNVGGWVDDSGQLGILWSICIEEQFYALFPWVIGALLVRSGRYRVGLIACALGLAASWRLVAAVALWPWQASLGTKMAYAAYFGTFSHLDYFIAGGLAGWLAARPSPVVTQLVAKPWSVLVVAGALGAVIWVWAMLLATPDSLMIVWSFTLFAAAFGLALLWVAEHRGSVLTAPLRLLPLRALGSISFGIYLFHIEAASWYPQLLGGTVRMAAMPTGVPLVAHIAIAVLFATVAYWTIERPCIRLGRRLIASLRQRSEVAALAVPIAAAERSVEATLGTGASGVRRLRRVRAPTLSEHGCRAEPYLDRPMG